MVFSTIVSVNKKMYGVILYTLNRRHLSTIIPVIRSCLKPSLFTMSCKININIVFQMYVNLKLYNNLWWQVLVLGYVVDLVPRMLSITFVCFFFTLMIIEKITWIGDNGVYIKIFLVVYVMLKDSITYYLN